MILGYFIKNNDIMMIYSFLEFRFKTKKERISAVKENGNHGRGKRKKDI